MGADSELYNESFNTTKFGDLSAILIRKFTFWIEITTVPSKKITNVRMGTKLNRKAIVPLKNQDVGSLTHGTKLDDGFTKNFA